MKSISIAEATCLWKCSKSVFQGRDGVHTPGFLNVGGCILQIIDNSDTFDAPHTSLTKMRTTVDYIFGQIFPCSDNLLKKVVCFSLSNQFFYNFTTDNLMPFFSCEIHYNHLETTTAFNLTRIDKGEHVI